MQPFYEEFISHLDRQDKPACVDFVLNLLSHRKTDIVTLYEQILAPSLRENFCRDRHEKICIWEEHVRTSIVRTIVECCYPYVIEERTRRNHAAARDKAVILCPSEEYHEIGARMVADFFTLCGYDAVFVGANTPITDMLEVIGDIQPQYLAISVSNSYNILAAQKLIEHILKIKEQSGRDFKIIAGGYAFQQQPEICRQIGADSLVNNFKEIERLLTGGQ
jgi:methanogenic corrinoid protein MtbC1